MNYISSDLDVDLSENYYGMYAGFSCKTTLIFKGIEITNCWQMIIGIIVMAFLCLIFELFLSIKDKQLEQYFDNNNSGFYQDKKSVLKEKILLMFIQLIVCTLSIVLMIGIMSYNLNIIITIVSFNAIGYLLFIPKEGRKANAQGCCNIS